MAGEVMGGMENAEPPFIFEGSIPSEGSSLHRFIVNELTGVRIQTRGRDGEACIPNTDTVIELFQIDGGEPITLARNDDYPGGNLCSRIDTALNAGEYEVLVTGFGGGAVEEYILEINFYPLLADGDACDTDLPELGLCLSESSCSAGICTAVTPVINSVVATQNDGTLFLTIEGNDPDTDTYGGVLSLLDINGEPLPVNSFGDLEIDLAIDFDQAPFLTGDPQFTFTIREDALLLDDAVSVEVQLYDFDNHISQPFVAMIGVHPTLGEDEACDQDGFSGVCDTGLLCLENQTTGTSTCSTGEPPVAGAATLFARSDALIASLEGSDVNGDIEGISVTAYDINGTPLFDAPEVLPIEISRDFAGAMNGAQRHFVTLYADLTPQISQISAVELALVDSTDLMSAPVLAVRATIPSRQEGERCDTEQYIDQCAVGTCYPDGAGEEGSDGVCRLGLPTLGEACDDVGGCEEGFTCYGNNNSGNLVGLYGTCMRSCDANVDPDGCELNELCLPDFDWASFGITDIPSPGVCLYSQGCQPGNEAESCGLDEASCLRFNRFALCVDLSNIDPANRAAAGEPCFGYNNPCDAGLICEAGICRAQCTDETQCQEAESCRLFDEVSYDDPNAQYSACMELCNPVSQDCQDADQSCVLFVSESSSGLYSVCITAEGGTLTDGELCDRFAGDGYWGDCTANNFCAGIFRGQDDQCRPICTAEDSTPCTEGRVCAISLLDSTDAGICVGECNFFTSAECGADQSCVLGVQGNNDAGELAVRGACADNPNVGSLQDGEACISDGNTGTNDCAPGHLCADLDQDEIKECVKLCQEGDPSITCPVGKQCITRLLDGSPVFGEELSLLGVCL